MSKPNHDRFHKLAGAGPIDHSGPDTEKNIVERLEDRISYISDSCASSLAGAKVDPRAWRTLLIYIPREVIEAHLKWRDEQDKKNAADEANNN
jgi:hypothetical protein